MPDCTGEEMLIEVLSHLPIKDIDSILRISTSIPTTMPYITSQFQPRNKGDRPKVIPEDSENFAFLGQFVEIPEDVVFTVEYSVRSAMMAVYNLLNIKKEIPPIYKGYLNPKVLLDAFIALNR